MRAACTEDGLRETAAAWDRAMVSNDADAIGRFMADEWRIVGSDGGITDRTAFLAQVRDGRLSHDTMTTEDAQAHIYGMVGVLVAHGVSAGRFEGRAFRVHERQSNVFVYEAGAWRCVLTHLSPLSAGTSGPGAA
jgi:ketosteroid isomerase-like protein